jgi:hypothetical protein
MTVDSAMGMPHWQGEEERDVKVKLVEKLTETLLARSQYGLQMIYMVFPAKTE